MRYFFVAFILMTIACNSGEKVYIPDPRVGVDSIIIANDNDTIPVSVQESRHSQPQRLSIDLAQIVGAEHPTTVTVKIRFNSKQEIESYTVTTVKEANKTEPPKLSKTEKKIVSSGYIVQEFDTKEGLARKFQLKTSQIVNFKIGKQLQYEEN